MTRTTRILARIAMAAAVVTLTSAPTKSAAYLPRLEAEEVAALSIEGRKLYKQAMDELDHIRYDPGLELLHESAMIEKDKIEIQELNARQQLLRARRKSGEEATMLYDRSIESLNLLIENPRVNARDRRKYERRLERAQAEKARVAERDERKARVGAMIQREIARERANPQAVQRGQRYGAPQAGGGGGGGGQGGGGQRQQQQR